MTTKRQDLGTGSIGRLLFSLSVPAIIAQLVNILYNIVDRIFIGRLPDGDLAMAGVGVAFPIIILISAFSSLIGVGGAPLAAIKMGEKNERGAEKIVSQSFTLLIALAFILMGVFYVFQESILYGFGASEATIGYGMDYLSIYLIGTLFVQISLGMNSFINTQGFAKTAMLTVSIGAIINIILDPIFIFGFDMGVQGAALATIIAQFASAAWVLFFLFGKQSRLKIRREYMRPTKKIVLPILALGVAPFVMQSTESLVIVSLNTQLQQFGGDLAVGSMTIMSSIMQLILLPLIGLSQGAQPIISYNYGAGAMERVRRTYQVLLLACLSYSILFTGMLMSEPEFFVTLFNNDAELVALTVKSMPLFFGGMFLFGAQIACQQTFLAVGEAKISLFLALLRKILLLVPLVYVLPLFFENKLRAVLLAESIADMSAVIITLVTFMIFYRKKLTKKRIQQAA